MDRQKMKNWISLLVTFAPGLFAAIFYGFTSGSMSFINKVLFHFFDVIFFLGTVRKAYHLAKKDFNFFKFFTKSH